MSKETESGSNKDEDLNDLLDSALKDFNTETREETGEKKNDGDEELWNEQFIAEQAKLLEQRMDSLLSGNEGVSADQINLGFQKMADAAALALQGELGDGDSEAKYADSIKEALKGLKEGIDHLQEPVVSETDIADMFARLNYSEAGDTEANPFMPFMQGMVQSLLSAEILLPSMKELLEKYPKYLEDNSSKIEPSDKERYMKQQELFAVICKDLESEKSDDPNDVKHERFKRVLDNMQKLHGYGQPPTELTGDVESGMPVLGAPCNNQCPMM